MLVYLKHLHIFGGIMKSGVLNVDDALESIDDLLVFVEHAETKLRKAKGWSIIDIFAGIIICNCRKYSCLKSAALFMEEINERLEKMRFILGGLGVPAVYELKINKVIVFFDYIPMLPFVSVWITSKISKSLKQIIELKEKIWLLKIYMESMPSETYNLG